ncbi:MAG: efflux RND transporter permease subunit [Gemmatimonadaceae bacterium]|nr:efflux RND transporter permease subunit [Gemmatimonadaceae bacterium]NUQ93615.1 efflux RND transporter permease subunit [Gemmatimonadaceae bacterium]NUS98241.1 efflux RND transporter permease subunit [Gemmatimonadaceae bacterium]
MMVIAIGSFLASFTIPVKGLIALAGALAGILVAVWLINRRSNVVLHILGMLLYLAIVGGGLMLAAGSLRGAITFGAIFGALIMLAIAAGAGWALWNAFRDFSRGGREWSASTAGGILVGVAVAAALVWLSPVWRNVGPGFFPVDDRAEFIVAIETPPGSNLAYTREKASEIYGVLRRHPEVKYTYATIGNQATGEVGVGNMYVRTVPKNERSISVEDLTAELRGELKEVGGATLSVFTSDFGGGRKQLQFQVRGSNDLPTLTRAADMVMAEVQKVPGAVDVGLSTKGQKPELTVELNRGVAGTLGITAGQVAQSLRPAFAGLEAGYWEDPSGETRKVQVRLAPESRRNTADLEQLPLVMQGPAGPPTTIPLGQVATVEKGEGPAIIDHLDRDLVVTVEANVAGRASGDVTNDIMARVSKLVLPNGVHVSLGGESKDQNELFGQIYIALGTAVLLMYLVLVLQFGSFVDPLAILVSLPLSLIGVMISLSIAGMTINIMSMIAIILLAGIVAKNAILLIDFAKWAREKAGMPLREALIEAGAIRLRPILMTTFALIAGMIPVALGRGEGAQFRAPLGVAVIGGVLTSTLLTLIVIPTVYEIMDGWRARVARLLGRQPSQKTAEHRIPLGEVGGAHETAD